MSRGIFIVLAYCCLCSFASAAIQLMDFGPNSDDMELLDISAEVPLERPVRYFGEAFSSVFVSHVY